VKPPKKIKKYIISFKPDENSKEVKKVSYEAISAKKAEKEFYKDYPDQKKKNKHIQIHQSVDTNTQTDSETKDDSLDLANYDPKEHWDNYEVPAETPNKDNNTNTVDKNNDNAINNTMSILMLYIKGITILLVGVIGLSLVVSALFGENTPFYSVVKNINVLTDNLNSFSGFIVLLGLTAFFTLFYKNN